MFENPMGTRERLVFAFLTGMTLIFILTFYTGGYKLKTDTLKAASAFLVDAVNSVIDDDNGLTSTSVSKPLLLLYWTSEHIQYFKWGEGISPLTFCPEFAGLCEFTTNHSRINESDILLFNMRDSIKLPPYHIPHQKWVISTLESPVHTYMKLSRHQGMFNLTMTYARSAGVPWQYGLCEPLSPTAHPIYSRNFNYAAGKKHLVAWFVSHCKTASKRETYAKALGDHVDVHQYGCGGKYQCAKGNVDLCYGRLLNDDYKFYLSFENALCRDYATEKLWRIFQTNVVPIVLGNASYSDMLPPHSYIDVRDFASPRHLANHLVMLDANDTLYNEYFRWRAEYVCGVTKLQSHGNGCNLCRHVVAARDQKEVITDLEAEWGTARNCITPKQFYRGMNKYLWDHTRGQTALGD